MRCSDRTLLGEYLTASEPLHPHKRCPSYCYNVYSDLGRGQHAGAMRPSCLSGRVKISIVNTRHTQELEQAFFFGLVGLCAIGLEATARKVGPSRGPPPDAAHGHTSCSAFTKHSAPCAATITRHTQLSNPDRPLVSLGH